MAQFTVRNFLTVGIMAAVFIIALKAALRVVPVPGPFKAYVETI